MDSTKFVELLQTITEDVRDYSGRAMYGRQCVGVTTDDVFGLLADIVQEAGARREDGDSSMEELADIIRDTKTDGMGLRTTVYWPYMVWPEGIETSDED